MTNKLQKKAQKSKLQDLKIINKETKIFPINHKTNSTVRSFRLDNQSWQDLQNTLEKLNSISQRKINTSRLIKALIQLGKKSSEKKLIKALKESSV
ncbi:MAG: hypothetical protein mread185_000151 [Mycoplasmataceae bacterium]|nr:MAG: hypothetical protein mread185_000151 [Mycoplasmataceae bacterium]